MSMTTKKKRTLTIALSAILVAAIAVGATLAYLATKTGEETNVFTFAKNIRAKLDEPNWDPEDAKNLTPGCEINKDPMITNMSDNGLDIYTALQLTFMTGEDYAGGERSLDNEEAKKLLGLLEISWNENWTLIDGEATDAVQIYRYNSALVPGEVSDPIFSTVKIKEDISKADMEWLAGIVMTHTDECYDFDDCDCEVTHKHHIKCKSNEEDKAEGDCDCTPATVHEAECKSITDATLKDSDCHHTVEDTISGFQIKVQGSAVQAGVEDMDVFDDVDVALIALFS